MRVLILKELRGARVAQVADEYSLQGRERILRQSERLNSWHIEYGNGGELCGVVMLIAMSELEARCVKDYRRIFNLYGLEARNREFGE